MMRYRLPFASVSLWASVLAMLGCGMANGGDLANRPMAGRDSVTFGQTPLSGNTIPKFVDRLPTFAGRRADATTTLHVNMAEFQQKVLPDSVYAPLQSPYKRGTYLWG